MLPRVKLKFFPLNSCSTLVQTVGYRLVTE